MRNIEKLFSSIDEIKILKYKDVIIKSRICKNLKCNYFILN